MTLGHYIKNNLISLDQGINTICFGYPDETISSRIGKRIRSDKATAPERWLAWLLDKIDRNHCAKNIEEDEGTYEG